MEREFLHREVNPAVEYLGEESAVYSTNKVQKDTEPGVAIFLVPSFRFKKQGILVFFQ